MLAIVVVSGAHHHRDSCSFSCPRPEYVAARKLDHHASHVVAVVVVVVVVSVIAAAAAAVILAAVLLAHARAIVHPPTCRVLDDSIRRVYRMHLLPVTSSN
jgi:hypothetical protein